MLEEINNKLSIVANNDYSLITYDKNSNTLFIPINQIDYAKLAIFIHNYKYSNLKILSTILINEQVIKAIVDNRYIAFLELGCNNDPYTLTREVFDLLNASENLFSIDTALVEGKYTAQEMDYLPFFKQMVVHNYTIGDLLTEKTFTFYQAINDGELKYLKKYLTKGIRMDFQYNDYANIINVIKSLGNKQIQFFVPKYDDLSFYAKDFEQLLNEGLSISFLEKIDFKQFIKIDLLLELMIKDIKESNLSPYEKYLAVYEIATHFKNYLENEDNWKDGRKLEYLLFNDFYVCYGVNELMRSLLAKVGIKAYNVSVQFYKKKEEISAQEQEYLSKQQLYVELGNKNYSSRLLKKIGNTSYHSRLLVKLDDPKYDIDGIFIADPTWDISLDHHLFKHSLLTFYEMQLEKANFYETDVSLFAVNNSQEFIDIIKRRKSAIFYFLEIIEVIDANYYLYLKKQYDLDISSSDMLLDIYEYIIKYTKHPVMQDKKEKALEELFNYIYPSLTLEERNKFSEELKNDNDLGKEGFYNGK